MKKFIILIAFLAALACYVDFIGDIGQATVSLTNLYSGEMTFGNGSSAEGTMILPVPGTSGTYQIYRETESSVMAKSEGVYYTLKLQQGGVSTLDLPESEKEILKSGHIKCIANNSNGIVYTR